MSTIESKLKEIRDKVTETVKNAGTLEIINDLRVKVIGKKGELTEIMKSMKDIPKEEKPKFGQLVNELRNEVEELLSSTTNRIKRELRQKQLEEETIDVTLPAKKTERGHKHPNQVALEEIERIFTGMGYKVVFGPEVEYDYYNFEALNIPADHPAKDEQDTFYINDKIVLRTQTSPVQVREMEKGKIPIRMIAPGRVFRSDEVDATHSPCFHQVEGMVIDEGITFADLKGTLEAFAKKMFGEDTKVKFRPHHFPFTEPSAEMDVTCFKCGGKGCRLCKGTGWIEVLGAGVVNKKVLENCGIDSEKYSGFAFGLGLERIAMLKYGINNIKMLFESDLRVLDQIDD